MKRFTLSMISPGVNVQKLILFYTTTLDFYHVNETFCQTDKEHFNLYVNRTLGL